MHHTEDDKKMGIYVRKVLEFIQMNLSEDLSLTKMAEIANYSPFHFHRIFTDFVGETPKQYIIRVRLERVAHYLKVFPNLSITELSDKSGFASLSTFSRAFKNYFGVSAEEYRKLSNEDYRKLCKTNSKKCKTFNKNIPDLCFRDFSIDDVMEWNNKVKITTKKFQGFKIIYLSTCLNNSDAISMAFRKISLWAESRGLLSINTRFVGMLLDIPFITPIDKCRYWAGLTFPEMAKLPREASVTEIPDGLYANYNIKGNLITTVKSLSFFNHGWLAESGYAIKDVLGYEIYAENPANKPYESIDREIMIPIRPAKNL